MKAENADAMHSIIERWNSINAKMEVATQEGRNSPPRLVAVSKGQPAESILSLLEAGHRDFGENRIQEAQGKWPALKASYPDVRLHLIGNLQTNKAKEALALFDVIHTVDRAHLAEALLKQRDETFSSKQFFLQVNTGEEEQKGGVRPLELEALLKDCQTRGLPVSGLMCIPPADKAPAPYFALLRNQAEAFGLPYLSMGMSSDYEIALRLGATHLRIGTALFGARA